MFIRESGTTKILLLFRLNYCKVHIRNTLQKVEFDFLCRFRFMAYISHVISSWFLIIGVWIFSLSSKDHCLPVNIRMQSLFLFDVEMNILCCISNVKEFEFINIWSKSFWNESICSIAFIFVRWTNWKKKFLHIAIWNGINWVFWSFSEFRYFFVRCLSELYFYMVSDKFICPPDTYNWIQLYVLFLTKSKHWN